MRPRSSRNSFLNAFGGPKEAKIDQTSSPDDVKNEDSITAYRDYYIKDKKSFATWKTTTPKWFAEAVECPY